VHLAYFALQVPLGTWIVYLAKGGASSTPCSAAAGGLCVMLLNRKGGDAGLSWYF
jgi:hypothetical protein